MGIKSKFSFYKDQPLFGLDIGHSSMKVMQLEVALNNRPKILGYGVSNYYPQNAIENGVIVNYDVLSQALHELFSERLIGAIKTRRVACTLPTSHTFSRPMKLPAMDKKDIADAVHLEAEQYIPIPVDNLYIDFEIVYEGPGGIDLLVVATPKNIIDSRTKFLQSLGLEPVALEPTMNASARLFSLADSSSNQPTILIDFGSVATDIAVFDKGIFVNSTVSGGSDTLTSLISNQLGIGISEAYVYKSHYGIGSSDKLDHMLMAAKPMLEALTREVRKIIRYYLERSAGTGRKISQIVTLGGGATMRGFNEYLAEQLNLPTKGLDPWHKIDFGKLEPPSQLARSMYVTVAGEAILRPEEIFG
ncbi:type IV pilus assembly protein PilM [Candidatus Saccharibacteria bacterium]|nr:type IV pilus assembly protein PilM [Candidatus Saccharibacteria bacterium]